MNHKAIDVLEYKKIIDMLAERAGSDMSRRMARELAPMEDVRVITEELRSTTEAVDLIQRKDLFPFTVLLTPHPMQALPERAGF